MKYEYVVERARDEKQMLENSCLADTGDPEDKPEKKPEDDWLDTSKACNLDDPECEVCQ